MRAFGRPSAGVRPIVSWKPAFLHRFNFNIFNFPQHFGVLKHRFEIVKEKKSVSEF